MAATVTKVVDPDNGGGTDYISLDAWEDALGGTTTGHLPNDDQIAQAQCRSSSGTDDTAAVSINGWTTDATRYIEVTGEDGVGDFPSDGIYDNTKYVLHNNDSDVSFCIIDEDYVRFRKIQVLVTETVANSRRGFSIANQTDGANLILIDSCIIKGAVSGTGAGIGVRIAGTYTNITIYNTLIYDFYISADTAFRGISNTNSNATNIYNCTIYNCTQGINEVAGTVTAKNCAVGNCDDDFVGAVTMDYIVSDDDHGGDCANYHAFPTNGAGDWSLDFTTPGSNFTLLATAANLIDDGVADLFTEDDDIIDTARPQGAAWDIGAFELIVAAGIVILRRRRETEMQGVHLRKYGVEAKIDFELYEVDGVDFRVDAVDASDMTIMKDEGAEASTVNSFVDEGNGYSVTLTATEMQAARIVLYAIDSATKVWLDKAIVIETYGNASAMHEFDLDDPLASDITTITSDLRVTDAVCDTIASDLIIVDTVADTIASDLIVADAVIDTIYSDTTAIASGINTTASDLVVTDTVCDTIASDLIVADAVLDTTYSDTTTMISDLRIADAVIDTTYSDTAAMISDLRVTDAVVDTAYSDTATTISDLRVADAVVDTIYSDTTAIASGVNTSASDLVVTDAVVDTIYSDTTAMASGVNTTASDLVVVDSDIDTVLSDLTVVKTVTDNLANAATTIVDGTVSWDNTNATTTIFYCDDITEATADHYKGREVIFTSGALQDQATDITAYALVAGEGKFSVTALTEAPADNCTFVIV